MNLIKWWRKTLRKDRTRFSFPSVAGSLFVSGSEGAVVLLGKGAVYQINEHNRFTPSV
jgi:hypothetical protein